MDRLTELLRGTLEGCVLHLIDRRETYGYEITKNLNDLGFTDVIEGTVYPILVRLEKGDLVTATKRPSDVGPTRKFFTLTDAGRAALAEFWQRWEYVAARINRLKEGAS